MKNKKGEIRALISGHKSSVSLCVKYINKKLVQLFD
jgi:hypothetical protein